MVPETTKSSKKRQFITVEQDGSGMSSDDASSGMESDHAPIKKLQGRKALLARQSSSDQIETVTTETNASVTPRNKQRVLLISSRGITFRFRHLLNDLHALFPHSKKDSKLDVKTNLQTLNELAELANCNNCVYFEVKRHSDLYMWISKTPNGPSAKLYVQNVHTMDELKMTGNCLKGSRPLLSFDKGFDSEPHWMLMKELLTQVSFHKLTQKRRLELQKPLARSNPFSTTFSHSPLPITESGSATTKSLKRQRDMPKCQKSRL